MESENVKERLNNLLQKKLSDQQERDVKESQEANECDSCAAVIKEEPPETSDKQSSAENSLPGDASSMSPADDTTFEDHCLSCISLEGILNEKKKALLQNEEVVKFLQNKMK